MVWAGRPQDTSASPYLSAVCGFTGSSASRLDGLIRRAPSPRGAWTLAPCRSQGASVLAFAVYFAFAEPLDRLPKVRDPQDQRSP